MSWIVLGSFCFHLYTVVKSIFVPQKPLFYVWVSLWWTMSWQIEQLICWLNGSERNSPAVSSSFIHKWDLAYKEGKRTRKRPPENEGNNLWNMMLGNTMFLLTWSLFFGRIYYIYIYYMYICIYMSHVNFRGVIITSGIFFKCLSWDLKLQSCEGNPGRSCDFCTNKSKKPCTSWDNFTLNAIWIWSNYIDLTRPGPPISVAKEGTSPLFRLVKYYNLARWMKKSHLLTWQSFL